MLMRKCICIFGEYRVFDNDYINNVFGDYDVFIHSNVDYVYINIKKLKGYLIDTCINNTVNAIDTLYGKTYPNKIYSMFYSVMMSNQLKLKYEEDNNFKYDLVIMVRSDLFFDIDTNFVLDTNVLNINDNMYSGIHVNKFLNDHFCISSSENIDKYSSLYKNINEYVTNDEMVAEIILKKHIDKMLLNTKLSKFTYIIKRNDGDNRGDFYMNKKN